VRATTFDWDESRRSIGAHTIYLNFADGAAATAVYNGYGYFSGAELMAASASGASRAVARARASLRGAHARAGAGGQAQARPHAIPASAPHQPHFGLTLVSCERGDIRQSPDGLLVYSERGREEIAAGERQEVPRDLVLDEFAAAIAGRARAVHDGRWGLANLEVCLAAIESSTHGKEIVLKHQVSIE
jgi:phthalate 4,5-cis-dihydrodiol dehydrogenase